MKPWLIPSRRSRPTCRPRCSRRCPLERAADLLEEMDPDDAADLLGSLEDADRSNLLDLMTDEDSTEMEKLLAYPEDAAGGIMTTEYATLPLGLMASQAPDYLRQSANAQEDETMYYVHIVDDAGRLRGTLTLRDLVMSDPEALVDDIMDRVAGHGGAADTSARSGAHGRQVQSARSTRGGRRGHSARDRDAGRRDRFRHPHGLQETSARASSAPLPSRRRHRLNERRSEWPGRASKRV